MKRGKVISLSEYKARRLLHAGRLSAAVKPVPDQVNLWELLDRNISIEIWKKEI
jgi:hypothetical protein